MKNKNRKQDSIGKTRPFRIDRKTGLTLFISTFMLMFLLFSTTGYAQITLFNNSLSSLNLTFPSEFMTRTFFVRVPNGTVTEARMRIQGFNMQGLKGLPRDVIIVTDLSGSMGQAVQGVVKLASAQAADRSFISNVDTNYIKVGLVNYSTVATLNQPLITNKVILNNSINSYRVGTYTNLGAALDLAINELNSVRAQRTGTKKYILLMTDGWANCLSSGSCADSPDTNRAAESWILSLARTANSSNITIFAIAFGDCGTSYSSGGGGSTAHCSFMQNVSNQTKGGLYFNASTGQALIEIYNNISGMIETTNLTTPTINSTSPSRWVGWSYPDLYNGNALWNGASCGVSGPIPANCNNFINLIQSNLNDCTSNPCDISFSVYSSTVGMLNLSELYIEVNQPPVSNYPPTGICLERTIMCGQTELLRPMDDGLMVTDSNDELSTLTWSLNSILNSTTSGNFNLRSTYNTDRYLNFSLDQIYENDTFWRTYYFNIADPWSESTSACINVSYTGCNIQPPVFEMSNRTTIFDYSAYPAYHYNLRNMIDTIANVPCTLDELGYRLSSSSNFIIYGPNSQGNITIIPNDPNWYNPTSEDIQVEAYCPNAGTKTGEVEILRGNADVILVTDYSGSMKKALGDWGQGTGVSSCSGIYEQTNEQARKAQLSICLDKELVNTVMSYQNNRIWPIFMHDDEIKTYSGNPTSTAGILSYLDDAPAQGKEKTCLACAINEGYDILNSESSVARNKFIVLMTDGVPTHCAFGSCASTATEYGERICNGFCDTNGQQGCGAEIVQGCGDEFCQSGEDNTLFSTAKALQDMNVIFYTIAFGLVEGCSRADMLLGQVASMSSGTYHKSSDVAELRQIYEDIATRITSISQETVYPLVEYIISAKANLTIIYRAPSIRCGDGTVNDMNEECDDGNLNNNDACSNICTITECNDTITQQPNGRRTLGPLNDGVEECDDGNIYYEDGCTPECVSEFCGDHDLQPGLGEECDDGDNIDNSDGCVNCELQVLPECGNVIIEVGEECDDGNNNNGDGCDSNCQIEGITGCGNAIIEDGEGCDDGNNNPDDGCDQCHLIYPPFCPNSVIEENEECDDGNSINGDGCSAICRLEVPPGCGNGIEEQGEQCDDGNTQSNDGCNATCQLETTPVLSLFNSTVVFDYSSYPGHNYSLDSMRSEYAILPCDYNDLEYQISQPGINFSINNPINPSGNITIVPLPDWYLPPKSEIRRVTVTCNNGAITYSDNAYVTIIYTAAGAPTGRITCKDNVGYMLKSEQPVAISLSDIFRFEGGYGVVNALEYSPDAATIVFNPPNSFTITSDNRFSEDISMRVETNNDITSEWCPVSFINLNLNCDQAVCAGCSDYACLSANGCLDGQTMVLNPFTRVTPSFFIPSIAPRQFTIPSFRVFDDFEVRPSFGDHTTYFYINDSTGNMSNGFESAAIINLNFGASGYLNANARVCPKLVRLNYRVGELSYDPMTDLLITGLRAVTGYYDIDGSVFSKGPYIFIAKVWLR